MKRSFKASPCLSALLLALIWSTQASAQLDRVYDTSGENTSGTIVKSSKQGVVLKRGGNNQEFPAGEIVTLLCAGDPAALTKGREFALDGHFERALAEVR